MNEYKITKYSDLNSDIIVFEYVKAEELRINPLRSCNVLC